jgi:DnaD/phage-associated family protein
MIKLNFQQDVLTLPGAVLSHCGGASAADLRVLLWLASDLSLAEKLKQLAKLADCTEDEAKKALDLWLTKGVLADTDAKDSVAVMAEVTSSKPIKAEKSKKLQRADTLPTYTSEELGDLLEKREEMRALVDEAQQILGKMFNPSEINILVGMMDYLGMPGESVLILLAYCKRNGKTNLRSIEKMAYTLVDKGITEPVALEEELRALEALRSFEGEVRTLFGMKSRALTTKESKMLRSWQSFGYGVEIVRMAYEKTVSATNEPSVPYTNAILERWNAEGLRSMDEIRAYLAEQESKKSGSGKNGGMESSFDTDDFFEAALRRSYQEN